MNVLVTGGSGFVGSAVVACLLDAGHSVTATATTFRDGLPRRLGLRWVEWDAERDPLPTISWDALDAVVHLAVPANPLEFPVRAATNFALGPAATFRLLEVARTVGISRVLVASTGDVLGPREHPHDESDIAYEPASFYGAVKACSEILTRSYESFGVSTGVLRFYHPYGPGGDHFLVNRLVRRVAAGDEISIEGESGVTLNPVWVGDLADGVRLAIESVATGAFHLAGPETITLRGLLDVIGDIVGVAPVVRTRLDATPAVRTALCERARRDLGYAPTIGIREGVRAVALSARIGRFTATEPTQKGT